MRDDVRFDSGVLSANAADAAAAYPNEGCGALLGPKGEGESPRITLTVPVPNSEAGRPRDRFEVAPLDYLAVEDEADRRGLSLVGFWHSHPDGAEPLVDRSRLRLGGAPHRHRGGRVP